MVGRLLWYMVMINSIVDLKSLGHVYFTELAN